jgi:GDP-L-fucose synthase
LAAAKVGGIVANNTYRAEFLHDNLCIQNNIIHQSYLNGVKKLMFFGSSCIYPKLASQPLKEEYILSGFLESTNQPYAIAKIAGLTLVKAFRSEYGRDWISLMPTNLYGPGDNFDLQNSHVLAALIRKIYEANKRGDKSITLWGSGKPRREFLHVDDFADAVIFCLDNYHEESPLNVGVGTDISREKLAEIISAKIGFEGEIKWDTSIPDGIYQKRLDISQITKLGWKPSIELEQGIAETINWFISNYSIARMKVDVRSVS